MIHDDGNINGYFSDILEEEDIQLLDERILHEQQSYYREKFEKEHNIKRDKRGRLNKGALLAKKTTCNDVKIWLLYMAGMSVKTIVENMGCSKSTVYNSIKRHKEKNE